MKFSVDELDMKINDIDLTSAVDHDRSLREQIEADEKEFGVTPGELDQMDNVELNIHVDYLINRRLKEVPYKP